MLFLLAILLGLITALANLLGSYLAILQRHPSPAMMANSIALGGGFILAAAILEMVPHAMEGGTHIPAFIALGYILVYLTEQLFGVHLHRIPEDTEGLSEPADDPPHPQATGIASTPATAPQLTALAPATGIAALMAFNVHDFLDGLAIGASIITSQSLGVIVFLAVLLHEIPAGFTIATMMRGANYSRKTALMAGLSIGLVTLVGIAIPFLVRDMSNFATDVFLGLAAGSFIYVGATTLIPAAETGHSKLVIPAVVLGFVLFYGSAQLVEMLLE